MTPHLFRELSAFLVSDIARRCANEPRHAVLLHVLAHVDADHQFFVVEEKLRKRPRQFRFADAGWPKKNEGADWPLGIG